MRVLYVEDNPANVFLVKRVAKMGNHEIINFVDGTEALARYKSLNPDLVLMDIQIAGDLNGLDVVKRLRADGVETPIIAVTAYAMVGDRERCIEAGCTDYMAKPLPIAQLVQVFEHYASHSLKKMDTNERLAISVRDEVPNLATKEVPVSVLPIAVETPSEDVKPKEANPANERVEEVASTPPVPATSTIDTTDTEEATIVPKVESVNESLPPTINTDATPDKPVTA